MKAKKKVGIVIQARLNSERLPGKVLRSLPYHSSQSILSLIIKRAKMVLGVDVIVVATTKRKEDAKVALEAKKYGAQSFRGDVENVLKRYCDVSRLFNLDVVVRLTGDNPCFEPTLISKLISHHIKKGADYSKLSGFPIGSGGEVISVRALYEVEKLARKRPELEHVTPYFYHHPKKFKNHILKAKMRERYSSNLRLTLDTIEDYSFLCSVFDLLCQNVTKFKLKDIVIMVNKRPWLQWINTRIHQKKVFRNRRDEIREAMQLLKEQDFHEVIKILKDCKVKSIF